MKTRNFKKSVLVAAILLFAAVALFAFGKGPQATSYKLSSKDWNTIDSSLKNYRDALNNYAKDLSNKGVLSSYQYEELIDRVEDAYSEMKKSQTIFLPGGFGAGMGPQNGQKGNGTQNNDGYGQQNGKNNGPMQYNNAGFNYQDFSSSIDMINRSRLDLQKSFLSIGLITQTQYDAMVAQENSFYDQIKNSNTIPYFWGFQYLFMLSGIND